MKITTSMFDRDVLHQIAEQKLCDLEEEEFEMPADRRKMVVWIMRDNFKYSYVWLKALAWLYNYDKKMVDISRRKKKWSRYLKKQKNKDGFSQQELDRARDVPIETLLHDEFRVIGGKKKALCPFHEENTPSFVIFDDNSYHCFGCQANGGNAIDFLIELEEVSFVEAVKRLL